MFSERFAFGHQTTRSGLGIVPVTVLHGLSRYVTLSLYRLQAKSTKLEFI